MFYVAALACFIFMCAGAPDFETKFSPSLGEFIQAARQRAEARGDLRYISQNAYQWPIDQGNVSFVVIPAAVTTLQSKPTGYSSVSGIDHDAAPRRDVFDPPDPNLLIWSPKLDSAQVPSVETSANNARHAGAPRSSQDQGPAKELAYASLHHHMVILNKFPFARDHLLLVSKPFQSQLGRLDLNDFAAACVLAQAISGIRPRDDDPPTCVQTAAGASPTTTAASQGQDQQQRALVFFNGGPAAASTQPRRHLQVVALPIRGPGVESGTKGRPVHRSSRIKDGDGHTDEDMRDYASPCDDAILPFELVLDETEAEAGAEQQVDPAVRGNAMQVPGWDFAHAAGRMPRSASVLMQGTDEGTKGTRNERPSPASAGAEQVSRELLGLYLQLLQSAMLDSESQSLRSAPRMDWSIPLGNNVDIEHPFNASTSTSKSTGTTSRSLDEHGEHPQGTAAESDLSREREHVHVPVPQHSLLFTDAWMLVVPRSVKSFRGIPVSAASYGGILLSMGEHEETLLGRGPAGSGAAHNVPYVPGGGYLNSSSDTGTPESREQGEVPIGPLGVLRGCSLPSRRHYGTMH